MKKRNIAICIILCFLTFGLYMIYWFVKLTDDINTLANPAKKTPGIVSLLLTIVTFGLYGIYWAYKMGALLDEAKVARGEQAQGRAVIYLILQLVFSPAAWILMQSSINSMIVE